MKNVRVIFLISAVITVLAFGVAVSFLITEPGGNPGETSFFDRFLTEDIRFVIIIVIVLLIMVGSMIPLFRIIVPMKIKNGIKTRAKVLEVRDTGVTVNDNPQVGLKLQFRTQEGINQVVDTKTLVSRLSVANVHPGLMANIVYDPLKPQRLQIESLLFEEQTAESDEEGDERPPSVTERLLELSDLRVSRLISEEEYQAKRNAILEEL